MTAFLHRSLHAAKRIGVACVVILTLTWGISLIWTTSFTARANFLIGNEYRCWWIGDGGVGYAAWHPTHWDEFTAPGWNVTRSSGTLGLAPPQAAIRQNRWRIWQPFWLPLSCAIAPTAILWLYDRRQRRPGFCDHCGYNLTGNTTGVCPECGTRMAPHI